MTWLGGCCLCRRHVYANACSIKNIEEDYTVFDYQKDCRLNIKEIEEKGKTPILVGGTGLYIKAALYDYKFEDENILNEYNEYTNEELYNKLLSLVLPTPVGPTIHITFVILFTTFL